MPDKQKYKHTTYFKKTDLENIAYSVWSPSLRDWRDLIEDYIEISKKRKKNKLAMFKLQIELLGDIVNVNNNAIKAYIKLVEDPEHTKNEFPDIENIDESVEHWEQDIVVTYFKKKWFFLLLLILLILANIFIWFLWQPASNKEQNKRPHFTQNIKVIPK